MPRVGRPRWWSTLTSSRCVSLLAAWDAAHGPVDEDTVAWAAAQFDQVDGAADGPEAMVADPPMQSGAA